MYVYSIIIYQILVSAPRTLPKHIYILYQIAENFKNLRDKIFADMAILL